MGCGFWSKKLLAAGIILYGIVLLAGKAEANSSDNQAPEWVISGWINSNGLTLADLRGKVVVIDSFNYGVPDVTSFQGPLWRNGTNNIAAAMIFNWLAFTLSLKDILNKPRNDCGNILKKRI